MSLCCVSVNFYHVNFPFGTIKVLCCVVLCCVVLCCVVLCCVVLCCVVLCCVVLCCVVLCCAVLCCAVLCCAVLCCAVLCCAVLCCAVLCCAVLCCAVLCCAVLCCVVLCYCPYVLFHARLPGPKSTVSLSPLATRATSAPWGSCARQENGGQATGSGAVPTSTSSQVSIHFRHGYHTKTKNGMYSRTCLFPEFHCYIPNMNNR